MPKALKSATEKFSRTHQPAAKSNNNNSGGTSNPLLCVDHLVFDNYVSNKYHQ